MLLCCSPKLNWMPKKPTFMLTICQNDKCGLCCAIRDSGSGWATAPATIDPALRPCSGPRQPVHGPRFQHDLVFQNAAAQAIGPAALQMEGLRLRREIHQVQKVCPARQR